VICASRIALLATFALTAAQPARTETIAEFFKGKTIELYVGTSVGGGYDAYARMLSRHMGKHIPGNPTLVPKNMVGGGGMRLANFLYNLAPKDGLAMGTFNRGTAFEPLLGNKAGQFEAARFHWIGSTNNEASVCAAWHESGISRFDQAYGTEIVVGATGPSTDTYQYPKIVNALLGTKFKIISGYPGGNEIDLAMERREVQARCGWSWTSVKATHPGWLTEKKINVLLQFGLGKHAGLQDTPLIVDLARNDDERAIFKLVFGRQVMAWPYVLPPGVPQDRIEVLRKAFNETMLDQAFLAEAAKANFEIRPVTGEDIQKLVHEIYQTPSAVVAKTIQLLQ
jgi:tripartite-type tricarboxylate transporter receptor subunit TctC